MYTHKQLNEMSYTELVSYSNAGYKLCYVDYEPGKEYDEENLEWVPFDDWETTSHMRAYFTPLPLNEQSGDDWDDAAYELNSGIPYDSHTVDGVRVETSILVIHFTSPGNYVKGCVETPSDFLYGSSVGVNMMNAGMIAWLFIHGENGIEDGIAIHAGELPLSFGEKIREHGETQGETD